MSSSVKPTQNKASNSSVPLANSAWSKGPPQSSATSRAQSPANANTPPTQPRRQSTLVPNGPPAVKQAPRAVAAGTGHRPTGSINFGSIEANQAPEKKAEATPATATAPPATAPATAKPAPAQPPANGVKVVAPTPTQPASTAPATTTASTAASTAPAAAATPPSATPTPSKQKKINIHALFQGGGVPSVTTTPPTNPPASTQPPVATPAAPPRGPGSGFNDRNNQPFPRSPQIGRPTLPGPSTSGGQRPAGSPRMSANTPLQHQHQHPMVHPHQHHNPHPGHPMQPPPQWGPAGYYYPPPHDYNPYAAMYGWPPQHQHPHMPQIHQPSMQPSPRAQPAQARPPSTPPVPNNASPHPLPPITTTALQAPPSAPSPSLSVNAPTFVPGGLRRSANPVRISTPNGDALTFEGQIPPSPKVTTPVPPKRQSIVVRMETEQQKNERLAKEKEERDKVAREKEEKERKEKERIEEEKRAKEEAERKAKEEEERKVREEAERKAEEERKAREEAERKAEEERKAKEEEERRIAEELRAKEEAERKAKEEEERKAREEAERLEAERKAKEEAERKAKEEEERKAREEEERKAKEEEERKAREKEEAEAAARAEAKAKEEAEKAKAEAEAKEAAEEEARDTVPASPISSPKPPNGLLPSTVPDRPSPLSTSVTATPGRPSPLSISTSASERPKRPVPGPLDLTSAQGNRTAAPPSALASARIIEDLNAVPYPETIKTPNPDLNIAATPGKFRYDRDFLLQFMNVCKEKPDSLPPLDAIGLEPGETGAGYSAGPRGGGRRLNSVGMGGTPSLQRQASVGLGLGPGLANRGSFAMGQFQSPSNSQSRFEASNAARGLPPFAGGRTASLTPMSRSASQGGVGGGGPRETKRTRSQRGRDRGDVRGSGFQTPVNQPMNVDFAPLEQSENRWVAGSTLRTPQQVEERQLVDRKVKALLNKLTMDKFDSISDQIIEWANKSEQEKDGSTLMQVIKLVFEKAKDEAAFSEMYARLCRKMMERVSPNVQDETIRNSEGHPITGGMLFRKYLLNRCQEDFERGWSAKEAALAAAALKSGEDKAAEAASEGNGEAVLYSDEYYAAAKAKRQGLGLVRFIGELFKLQMLTERIMHECIKKLLSNVVNPEEEEIESLCKLLTTVGQSLDNPKARNHMDIYFERMQEMAKGGNINSRMQFMLLDVIELRARHWQSRATLPRPPPASQDSSRDDAGRHNVTRGGSRRGEHRGANATEPDGWNVAGGGAARPSARAGDLSQFGKIQKPTGIQFGPSSVFSKKDANKRDSSIGRAGGANMFSALSTGAADGPPPPVERTTSSRKPSVDLGPGGSPATASGERRKLNLLPRTKPTEAEADKAGDKEEDKEEAPSAAMTEEEAQTKVKEDVKEYLGVENIDEAIMALEALPSEHRHLFVDKLTNASMDGGNKVVVLAEKLFSAARSRSVISPEGFERGLLPTIEVADDLSIDVPKTYEWLARMIHAAGLDKAKAEEMAGKISVYGEPRVPPRELLIKEFEKVSSA